MKVTILGCGSAKPTKRNSPSGQILEMGGKQFLIDCGEGVQLSIARYSTRINRLDHIFISHLHGDHCFGLIGLISTMGMLGRTRDLYIHAQPDLQKLMQPWLDYFCEGMTFSVIFENYHPRKRAVIYEDRTLTVETIPLHHRVPTAGFIFKEKEGARHLKSGICETYDIPIPERALIKLGKDYTLPTGEVIPNEDLTTPPTPPQSYAYCSDTQYFKKLAEDLKGTTLLFHEATYANTDADKAKEHFHSTAQQAAQVAKDAEVQQLIIGHFSSRYDEHEVMLEEARAVFENTQLAIEGKEYDL